ncbi:MAG: cobalt-zinc-cadmium resistance protein CzcA [Alteromonadaceae bacterium]|jgi:cobalt-zinc-cadmium resistance protein CzcA
MLNRLINIAITHRLMMVLVLIIIVATSGLMIPKLNLDAFPDVTNVQVAINTEARGLAAEEVEKLITFPIESLMYALPNVEQVRSISKTGLSGITVVFKEGTDIYFARQLVFERLQSAKEIIPAGSGTPEIGPNTSGLGQIYQYLLAAEPETNIDITQLRSLNDWLVKLLLMPIDGVTDVLSFGGKVKQYQVNINPTQLLAYQVNQQIIIEALKNNNQNAGGWYLERGQEQLVIRGLGWLDSEKEGIEQIKQIPIKTIDGTVVTISDVAEVVIGSEIRQGAATMSKRDTNQMISKSREVVTGVVLKRLGANTKATIDSIKQRQHMINEALPEGVSFEVIYDQADLIEQAINTVINALLFAFILIICVLMLFLMNLSATFLVLISIPVSIGIALSIMAWLGISANLMSLGGLAIAIGMLVDGSVVIVENIINKLKANVLKTAANSNANIPIIIDAVQQVAKPVFFATIIILVVFLPLFSFTGVEAKLFQPMATSIMIAIISALIVALFFVPALAVYLFKNNYIAKEVRWFSYLIRLYQKLLSWSLCNPRWVLAFALSLLLMALVTVPKLGTEFVPELEEGTLNIRVTLAPSSSLNTALMVAPKLEQLLLTFPEVNYALSRIGRPELGGDPEPVNNIEIYVGLKSKEQWTSANSRQELQGLMAEKLALFPGLLFTFSQPIATRVDELLSGVKAQLAIKLFGPDLDILTRKGQAIEQAIKQIAGTKDVALEQVVGETQLVIKPKRRQLSRYGLAVSDVMAVVQKGIGGSNAGQIIQGNERYDINVRFAQAYRKDIASISNIRLLSSTGAWVRLSDVADIEIATGPPQIRRDDVQRRVVIQANIQNRDMGSVVNDIRATIARDINLPAGYSVVIGGQYESQQRAQNTLTVVIPLSLLLIALLLYFAFNSITQTLLILVNVPLAVIGGIFALYFTEQYLSVPSAVGFITLFGVAVLNGVVMVESINQQLKAGLNVKNAVFTGASSRLRPVLITAITSALGLIPMLLSQGIGAEIQKPLATVVVGGLVTATLLTLFVLPSLYLKLLNYKAA